MSNIIIKAENISKSFVISHETKARYNSLGESVSDYAKRLLRRSKQVSASSTMEEFWALKDINFEIKKGDRVGIVGRNGAGKSTLLKVLSRITDPTSGRIQINGRVASLLEVGTGFHPELTGRENIFLNGSILGMSRTEIRSKFDEIVAFAEVDKFLDTPVKRYSSGMYVRLAFAVAAHLEPEILIVDEVLAVGDVQFQKKCLGKMEDISTNEGRTVLFVSHNMGAIQKLCNLGILLDKGTIKGFGKVDQIVSEYLDPGQSSNASIYTLEEPTNKDSMSCYAVKLRLETANGNPVNEIIVGSAWQIRVYFKVNKPINHFIIALGITNSLEINIRTAWSLPIDLENGFYEAIFKEEQLILAVGNYNLTIGLSSYEKSIQYLENAATIYISDVQDSTLDKSVVRTSGVGILLNPMKTNINQASEFSI
jgi:lipopolysaccharide transport system ATP-binding protein